MNMISKKHIYCKLKFEFLQNSDFMVPFFVKNVYNILYARVSMEIDK